MAALAQAQQEHTGGPLASLRVVADGLLDRPDPALDDALNAAAECFIRHGFAHTSVRDIAAELGVSKATVYRRAGSVDDLVRALVARDVHQLIDGVVTQVGDAQGAAAVLEIVCAAADFICEHPLVRKIVADEPGLVAELLPNIGVIASSITAILTTLIDAVRPNPGNGSEAAVVAEVSVRVVLAAVFVPPGDLDALVRNALGPHLRA
ncbi:MAG: TetR/AcrR family transcriptional regulator [Acidimicrobiales bacterium]